MRRKDREIRDSVELERIIDSAKFLHLGLMDREYPYVVPLHYGYELENGKWVFYMHGAKEGRKLDLIRANPNVCIELETEAELISGGDVACRYGSSYASVIGIGKAKILEETEEKIHGLQLLMQHQTGRDFSFTEQMAAGVAVIRVTLQKIAGKERKKPGQPG